MGETNGLLRFWIGKGQANQCRAIIARVGFWPDAGKADAPAACDEAALQLEARDVLHLARLDAASIQTLLRNIDINYISHSINPSRHISPSNRAR